MSSEKAKHILAADLVSLQEFRLEQGAELFNVDRILNLVEGSSREYAVSFKAPEDAKKAL